MNKVIVTGRIYEIRKRERITYATLIVYDSRNKGDDFLDISILGKTKEFFDTRFEKNMYCEVIGRIKKNTHNPEKIFLEILADEINYCGAKQTPPVMQDSEAAQAPQTYTNTSTQAQIPTATYGAYNTSHNDNTIHEQMKLSDLTDIDSIMDDLPF